MAQRIEDLSLEDWDESLSTGIASLDEQHRMLFHCVDLLAEAATERSMLRTFYVMEQLSHYVHAHFAEEEFLMRAHQFPGLVDHIREHRSFANRLRELRKIYLDRDISLDLVAMLKDWLRNHVAQTDMEYVPYLAGALPLSPAVEREMIAATVHGREAPHSCLH